MEINTVLLDLDGVIRHFDPTHIALIEEKHELGSGRLTSVAFEPQLLDLVITGRITRRDWGQRVGMEVDNVAAAEEWLAQGGQVDWEVVAVVDDLRARGVTVAVLTNGTDTVSAELQELGVTEHLDAIFNSAEIGFAKPDRRAFEHVCQALEVQAGQVFFTDDSASKLTGATEIGMTARLFEGIDVFRHHLTQLLPEYT